MVRVPLNPNTQMKYKDLNDYIQKDKIEETNKDYLNYLRSLGIIVFCNMENKQQ